MGKTISFAVHITNSVIIDVPIEDDAPEYVSDELLKLIKRICRDIEIKDEMRKRIEGAFDYHPDWVDRPSYGGKDVRYRFSKTVNAAKQQE